MTSWIEKLAALMHLKRDAYAAPPTRKEVKAARPQRYKPAFSCGFRGFPKTHTPIGSVPAPTIDQVRKLERTFMCRLVVKQGLIYFREDGKPFSHAEGLARRQTRMEELCSDLNDEGLTPLATAN